MLKTKIHRLDERDHHEHGGGERIENPANGKWVRPKSEPGEVKRDAITGLRERCEKRHDGKDERSDLTSDGQCRRCSATRVGEPQHDERNRQR